MSAPLNEPAFPNTGNSNWGMDPTLGMTLRDWFAGQALSGVISATSSGNNFPMMREDEVSMEPAMARAAYLMADAMLTARAEVQA